MLPCLFKKKIIEINNILLRKDPTISSSPKGPDSLPPWAWVYIYPKMSLPKKYCKSVSAETKMKTIKVNSVNLKKNDSSSLNKK